MWIEIIKDGITVYIQDDSFNEIVFRLSPFFECIPVSDISNMKSGCWRITGENGIDKNTLVKITPVIRGDKGPQKEYYVDEEDRIIYVSKPDDPRFISQVKIRLARDIIKHTLMSRGFSCLHGGMVSYQGKGICFLGEKKHGKTSFMLSMLATGKASFISNDDISISAQGSGLEGTGFPRSISVRKDSIGMMDNILNKYDFTKDLKHPDNGNKELSANNFYFVNELADIFGCDITPKAGINCFLYLEFTDGELEISEVKGEEKIDILRRFVDPEVSRYFMDFKKYFENSDNRITAEIEKNIENIPFYAVKENIYKMNQTQEWIGNMLNG
ncbi:MAG: hypothetical protein J5840_06430 [Lachnospiraceae bacterium]|nr:hypothetical protein [Lachnospiraceae bacterium]